MYHQALIDHYKHSSYRTLLHESNLASAQYNPSCGDQVSFQALIADNLFCEIAFQGAGCVISQATASLLCEHFAGKSISMVTAFSTNDLLNLIGITLGPNRLRCALIALMALQEGVSKYLQENKC